MLDTVLTCAFAQWSPGLGDNHPVGWMTVLVYVAAYFAAARVAQELGGADGPVRRERAFWWVSAGLLLFLAINKQLDLQSLVTVIGRCHAQMAGWYEQRRTVQWLFILAVAGSGLAGLGLLALLLRGVLDRVWPALLGLGFVCGFVVIRAASFHHVDALIGGSAIGMRVNWLLELPGPALVTLVALHRHRTLDRARSRAGSES